jgi:uncharacterized protein (DUF362 family)
VKVFDRPVNDPRRCYVQSGIAPAVKALGAEADYMDERKFRDMELKGGALKSWPLYSDIFEADKVINIPIAKHHGLAKLTMSMKNWMGVMGGERGRIHQKIGESLADICLVIKPTLTVLDAVRILTENGPQGGNLKDVKRLDTVIVGRDQVAIDSYGATLFGMKGSDLSFVRRALQQAGVMDLSMKIKSECLVVIIRKEDIIFLLILGRTDFRCIPFCIHRKTGKYNILLLFTIGNYSL